MANDLDLPLFREFYFYRTLRFMRMRVARIDFQSSQLLLAEGPMLKHAGHRMPEWERRLPLHHVAVGALAKATGIARVARIQLVRGLLAGHADALDVDHDHVVPSIQMRRVDRLVLAAQQLRHIGGETTARLAARVDQ